MLKKRAYGYSDKQKINTPLKNFVRCAACDTPLTAYRVKKKRLNYYKYMHQIFEDLLRGYEIQRPFLAPLRDQLLQTYANLTKEDKDNNALLKNALAEVSKNINTVEERFALGIIGHDIYERFFEKLRAEKRTIEEKLEQAGNKISNPEKFVEYAFKMCSNLSNLWVSGDFEQRVKLQEIVFPDGLLFDKENQQL